MIITLSRDRAQPKPQQCTLGILTCGGKKFHTIERPWIPSMLGPAGEPGKSCLPVGAYKMQSRETEARGKHWILSNQALRVFKYPSEIQAGSYGRSLILIHSANWAHELHGCIAPGKSRLLDRNGEWMVTSSRAAMNELRTLIGNAIDLQLIVE